ncbi:MAG: SurA N-terminal domain-containing protein [Kiritimatiellia bacterium]
MRKALFRALAVLALAVAVVGGSALWRHRPWRPAVTVNGHVLSVGELDLRAQTLLDDARRVESLAIPRERAAEALAYYRRQAAKMWIIKEVLLAEALARGFTATAADERESLAQIAARLKGRGLTPDEYFREGPLPEEIKRRDHREGVLINKFTAQEVRDKITITPREIDARLGELQRLAQEKAKPGEKASMPSRKRAIDSLRGERFRQGFRRLFRDLFAKADVTCPAYPELTSLDAISPTR